MSNSGNDILSSELEQIRFALHAAADDAVRKTGSRFFKEPVLSHGVKITTVSAIAREVIQRLGHVAKRDIFALCGNLWQSGFLEEGIIACNLAHSRQKEYERADFDLFESWVDQYITNWATCDTLCNHTIGDFVMAFPEYVEALKLWTSSENRWKKRAASVTLIVPARKGHFLTDIFTIADNLISDSDDLVQKGYGWMLKCASQAHQRDVFEYLMERKAVMPRTAFRYALEKMPKEMRTIAMKK